MLFWCIHSPSTYSWLQQLRILTYGRKSSPESHLKVSYFFPCLSILLIVGFLTAPKPLIFLLNECHRYLNSHIQHNTLTFVLFIFVLQPAHSLFISILGREHVKEESELLEAILLIEQSKEAKRAKTEWMWSNKTSIYCLLLPAKGSIHINIKIKVEVT